jgi:hypothetical protein
MHPAMHPPEHLCKSALRMVIFVLYRTWKTCYKAIAAIPRIAITLTNQPFSPIQKGRQPRIEIDVLLWWSIGDSNSWPLQCECSALPTALMPLVKPVNAYVVYRVSEIYYNKKHMKKQGRFEEIFVFYLPFRYADNRMPNRVCALLAAT